MAQEILIILPLRTFSARRILDKRVRLTTNRPNSNTTPNASEKQTSAAEIDPQRTYSEAFAVCQRRVDLVEHLALVDILENIERAWSHLAT